MQHKAVYLLFCKFTLHVSGVNHTHHREYTKLKIQPPVLVIFFCAATSRQCGQAWPRWREVPESVLTVLRTPEDGCV